MENRKIKIRLKKSVIGVPPKQRDTVKSLGLRKMHQTVVHNDTPSIRGMIKKIPHLVEVSEEITK